MKTKCGYEHELFLHTTFTMLDNFYKRFVTVNTKKDIDKAIDLFLDEIGVIHNENLQFTENPLYQKLFTAAANEVDYMVIQKTKEIVMLDELKLRKKASRTNDMNYSMSVSRTVPTNETVGGNCIKYKIFYRLTLDLLDNYMVTYSHHLRGGGFLFE